ncbi:TrwC protein [Porphyrobacter sp. HT-58-2]|uniref:MobF family relaxase n=1 Tax=Porphyrobacter sp. HT-58-2 TaxID=2023229 RepID=UPI000CDBABAB|nr:MobF family relaxase [Porphyrobacter sp. HT-58-2]AUX69157.1 TrwC protein [Porphyrobacter sp. HT-58-2]
MMTLAPSPAAEYYTANYYTADHAVDTSAWFGRAAEALGLAGKVDQQVFSDVLDGKLPDGSVIAAKDGVHRPGVDLTFSASKSISLLAMLGGDKRLIEALKESVAATLSWAENNVIEARVWDAELGRQIPEKTKNLLAATFLHDVNRNGEPQLHIHAVTANATLASDGKWHAVRNDQLYRSQRLLSAIHNADLRDRVEALGYETVPAKRDIDGAFEIKGVSREAVDAFSSRRAEILAALAKEDRGSARERELAALSTRRGKEPEPDAARQGAAWNETARAIGFDPSPLVESAMARAAGEQTVWSRVMEGVRGIGARGMAIASAMGLTPKDRDPLVPERLGRLEPKAFAAAQAVASAARELGEREEAFSRNDLIRTALQHQGPITVASVEARIDQLHQRGLLIGSGAADKNRMVTTAQALALEEKVIALAMAGKDSVQPIADKDSIIARLQEQARAIGLRRLNTGQEQAGVAILTSKDRVHLVQGGAGVGKSAALAPVAAIAREEGRQVVALSHVGRIAREFGEKTASTASTVDGFLARYARVIDGSASADKVAAARAELSGALVMVDEASQIGTDRLARLITLANQMDVGKLVLAGDIKQLPAIEAGKPFAQLQQQDLGKSEITENLRAQTPQMVAINSALQQGDVAEAFAVLKPATTEVASGKIPDAAAAMWANLPKDERDNTILLAAGRAMRSAGNAAAQEALIERGEIGERGIRLAVLDRVTITREGARQLRGYHEGRVVAFETNLTRQGFARGERGTVLDIRDGKVELAMPDGEIRRFDPDRLPRNLKHDAVTIFERKPIDLHEGDRIRWTAKDGQRGLLNGDIAHVARIDGDTITVKAGDGHLHNLVRGDPMLERLDLAYAINVHVAQGMTAKDGIIMMSERERMLNTSASFLVAVTRIAENAALVTDNPSRVERQVEAQTGEKTSATETARAADKKPALPDYIKEVTAKVDDKMAAMIIADYYKSVEAKKEEARNPGRTQHENEYDIDMER